MHEQKYAAGFSSRVFAGNEALAQQTAIPLPKLSIEVGKATNPEDVSVTLQILLLMTILSLAPAILILTTALRASSLSSFLLNRLSARRKCPRLRLWLALRCSSLFLSWLRSGTKSIRMRYSRISIRNSASRKRMIAGSTRCESSCSSRRARRIWRYS